MNVYTNGKLHKDDCFTNRKQRDEVVKGLRKEGWLVKAGVNHFPDSVISTIYWYEAIL